ncbi:MAG: DUF2059 domain-containing protein [Alistipes sp.]|nr:DUF2059 domain-containing protein [Alistipes sp.]
MKKYIVLLIGFAVISAAGYGQSQDEKYRREFDEFLEYSMAAHVLSYLEDQMDSYIEEQSEEVAARIKEIYPLIRQHYADFIYESMMPMYRERISYKDLRKINRFYRSAAGQRFKEAQKPILMELIPEGEQLVMSIGELLSGCFEQ